jgi:SAM-dependent methyltransferase
MQHAATTDPRDAADAAALARKIRLKFLLRRLVGELYVGKRMKMRYLRRALPALLALPQNARILEVGSEDGAFTDFLARLFPRATVHGMELRPDWAAGCAAWAAAARRPIRFFQGDVLSLAATPQYDAIFCLDVLGYIPDDRRAVANMARALAPGGALVVHQPHPTYTTFNGTQHHVAPEDAGKITGGHVRHGYTVDELAALAASAGLVPQAIVRLHGRYSDLAHRLHRRLERPAPLRLLAAPLVDILWALDARASHAGVPDGNTVLAVLRKPAGAAEGPTP